MSIKEIIIIDNSSSDSTVKVLENTKNAKILKIVRNNKNVGFARAVNQGIRMASTKYVLLLNPDTILQKDSLKELISCSEKNGYSVLGGKTLDDNGNMHGTYVRKPDLSTMLFEYSNLRKLVPNDSVHQYHYYHDMGHIKKPLNVDAVSGSFMLIDLEKTGKGTKFDENFFMYLEDIDFCVRVKNDGGSIGFCPNSVIYHIGGASSNNTDRINYRGWEKAREHYARKHFGLIGKIVLVPLYKADTIVSRIWRQKIRKSH